MVNILTILSVDIFHNSPVFHYLHHLVVLPHVLLVVVPQVDVNHHQHQYYHRVEANHQLVGASYYYIGTSLALQSIDWQSNYPIFKIINFSSSNVSDRTAEWIKSFIKLFKV